MPRSRVFVRHRLQESRRWSRGGGIIRPNRRWPHCKYYYLQLKSCRLTIRNHCSHPCSSQIDTDLDSDELPRFSPDLEQLRRYCADGDVGGGGGTRAEARYGIFRLSEMIYTVSVTCFQQNYPYYFFWKHRLHASWRRVSWCSLLCYNTITNCWN